MNDVSKDMVTVLDQTIEFMEAALQEKQASDTRIQALIADLEKVKQDQERVVLEKVADARQKIFDARAMDQALVHLNQLGVISKSGMEKLAARIKADPNSVFPIMIKLADTLLSAPGDGSGVEKESSAASEDPDGWGDFISGRPVKVRR